jgi:broad specificity phosphatase PhoE
MSDLQCAATLLLASPEEQEAVRSTGEALTERSVALAGSLASARVAAVYCSGAAEAVQTAGIVAARLGLPAVAQVGLLEPTEGVSEADTSQRSDRQLQELADVHRGETVLVVGDTKTISTAVRGLFGSAGDPSRRLAQGETVALLGDADGWRLAPAPGSATLTPTRRGERS